MQSFGRRGLVRGWAQSWNDEIFTHSPTITSSWSGADQHEVAISELAVHGSLRLPTHRRPTSANHGTTFRQHSIHSIGYLEGRPCEDGEGSTQLHLFHQTRPSSPDMPINALPNELLSDILLLAARTNEADGESFTYGLSEASVSSLHKSQLIKYVRGPLSAESLRWDATRSIRQVCMEWHSWALSYNLEHVLERKWRGSERWANLCLRRPSYALYELIDKPSGQYVYRDPFGTLKHTAKLFDEFPSTADHVRRLWFDGYHTAETDRLIFSVVASCNELASLSVPWTVLRRGTADDWIDLLNVKTGLGKPLRSLELQAVSLSRDQALALESDDTPSPLDHACVDFSALKRLKIFGNTLHKPVTDHDLYTIARTATNLECLDITNLSTVSVAGVLALVKASRDTLQVLEHSPRSDDGFFHPYPGQLDANEHMCCLITSLPQMRDLSLSMPHLCADFFANQEVHWAGECQIRTTNLCGCDTTTSRGTFVVRLRDTFAGARTLIAARARLHHSLAIEIFFAACIFEPEKRVVHGDFTMAEIASHGQWPHTKSSSTKGPYGTSGVYEKAEGSWHVVGEEEYLDAVERGWVAL